VRVDAALSVGWSIGVAVAWLREAGVSVAVGMDTGMRVGVVVGVLVIPLR